MAQQLRRIALVLVLAVAACARRAPPPTAALDEAAADVADGEARPRAWALAGLRALLTGAAVDTARGHLDTAVRLDASEPYGLYGQLLLAQRQARGDRAVTIALDLVERAPRHPLSAVAARVVLEHATVARGGDDEVLARVPALTARPMLADTAHLLRAAVAAIAEARGDAALVAATLADMGVPTALTVLGPFSPWHVVSTVTPTPPEKTLVIPASAPGPFGALTPRAVRVPDGRLSLAGEPAAGDVYLFAVDVEVPVKGRYVLRTVSAMDHVASLDGTAVLARSTWQRPASTLSARAVWLSQGPHRLLVRAAKEDQAGHFQVALQRLDGAPAGLTFAAATGASRSTGGVELLDDVEGVMPAAADVHAALADEASDALARLVAARDGAGRDQDGARAVLDGVGGLLDGPMVHLTRAELDVGDRFLAPKVATGRAARDLEAALAKDEGLWAARLASAQLALDDGRQSDALELLRRGKGADGSLPAAALWLTARVELSQGLEAQAVQTARAAQAAWAGHCEALGLEYDVARRRDAVAEADALLERSRSCPDFPARAAEHHKARGRLEAAVAALRGQLARDDGQVQVAATLASALSSLTRFDEAVAVLEEVTTTWPRHVAAYKQLADVHELAGRPKEALAARERAL
ncbi:MAG: tetratricopeptide repeat protein, partial [Myxococcaceae bacterium]|nr:tetratricopeptide repeat protein [Myxococcaceae bacterium]